MNAIPIREAARALRCSTRTIYRALERGAPFVSVGARRHVDVEALRRWRDGELLRRLEQAIAWCWRGDCGTGVPAWRELAVPERALALLLVVYQRAAPTGAELPPSLRHLESRLLALQQSRGAR